MVIRRGEDPVHLDHYEPDRKTYRNAVLKYLQDHAYRWVDPWELEGITVGGRDGTRRARELRAMGYPILNRPRPDQLRIRQWRWGG